MNININFGNIWEALSAIGTIGAVGVSLLLARRDSKKKILVNLSFAGGIGMGAESGFYLTLDAVNISDTTLEIEEIGFFYKKTAKRLTILGTQALVEESAEIPYRVAPMSKAMYIIKSNNIVTSAHNEWGENVRIKGYVRDSIGNMHFSKKRIKL